MTRAFLAQRLHDQPELVVADLSVTARVELLKSGLQGPPGSTDSRSQYNGRCESLDITSMIYDLLSPQSQHTQSYNHSAVLLLLSLAGCTELQIGRVGENGSAMGSASISCLAKTDRRQKTAACPPANALRRRHPTAIPCPTGLTT